MARGAAGGTVEVVGSTSGEQLLGTVKEGCAGVRDALDELSRAAIRGLGDTWSRRHGEQVPRLVVDALILAAREHAGQRRLSGELYLSHPVTVACIVAEMGLDAVSVAAACCHDVLEDCDVTEQTLCSAIGKDAAGLVAGVTKVDRVKIPEDGDVEVASMTKFLVAVAQDVRVLAIKLADRLHNMRTIAALPESTRRRKAREALEVFSPLAHRLGMEDLRRELEDLAFAQVHPEAHAALSAAVRAMGERLDSVEVRVVSRLEQLVQTAGMQVRIDSRTKHLYSIWEKQRRSGTSLGAMHDLVGVRVVVADIAACYQVLGMVHGHWQAVPGRFKDFISVPRPGGYRSLHTTIMEDALDVEVQIRTEEMDLQARFGVAAHYLYKQSGRASGSGRDDELVAALSAAEGPEEFLERLRTELVPRSQIVVLSPKGRAVTLPAGACAIDFAYHIHTEIGHRCVGARMDGELVPIRSSLRNGTVVEIVCAKTPSPRRDWLEAVRTGRAREKIRRYLADLEPGVDPAETGRTLLREELRKRGAELSSAEDRAFCARLAQLNGFEDIEDMLCALSSGNLRANALRGLPARARWRRAHTAKAPALPIDALQGLPFSIARCCNPGGMDEVAGFVSRSRVVTVHRSDCPNYLSMVRALPVGEVGRLLTAGVSEGSRAWVEIVGADRSGLLFELAQACAAAGTSIMASTTRVDDGLALVRFELDVVDKEHVRSVCSLLETVDGVTRVSTSGNQ